MTELKHYKIEIFQGDQSLMIIKSSWLPDDPERFAWYMGGDKIEIEEINNPQPN